MTVCVPPAAGCRHLYVSSLVPLSPTANEGIVPDRNDPNVYTLVIPGKESRHCALQFTPRDVSAFLI